MKHAYYVAIDIIACCMKTVLTPGEYDAPPHDVLLNPGRCEYILIASHRVWSNIYKAPSCRARSFRWSAVPPRSLLCKTDCTTLDDICLGSEVALRNW